MEGGFFADGAQFAGVGLSLLLVSCKCFCGRDLVFLRGVVWGFVWVVMDVRYSCCVELRGILPWDARPLLPISDRGAVNPEFYR